MNKFAKGFADQISAGRNRTQWTLGLLVAAVASALWGPQLLTWRVPRFLGFPSSHSSTDAHRVSPNQITDSASTYPVLRGENAASPSRPAGTSRWDRAGSPGTGIALCGWFGVGGEAPHGGEMSEPDACGCATAGAVEGCSTNGMACAGPPIVSGVDSRTCVRCGEPTWSMRGPIPWQVFAQGEYAGPHRHPHVPEYRLRVDDEVEFIYRLTREWSGKSYELNVGDRVRIESLADKALDRELEVQPDGTITLPLIHEVIAAHRTTDEIRLELEKRFLKYYKEPTITVTPVRVNTKLEDLRTTVGNQNFVGGQSRNARVAPDGTLSLVAIGPVPAQGLTLQEFKREIDARYGAMFDGIEITPVLLRRAPRFIYVVGDVAQPGRYELVGPTTVIQAIALAQGANVGANLRQIVIFRRAADWRLLATKVDVRGALYGHRPAPSDELWLRDADIVIVPKSPVKNVTDMISLIATRGFYAVAPFVANGDGFNSSSSL